MTSDLILSLMALSGHFIATSILLCAVLRFSPIMVHVISGLIFMAGFIAAGLGIVPQLSSGFNIWPGLSLLAFGSMVFLFVYSGIYKSISLRFLVELADRHPAGLTVDELYARVLQARFVDRIELLSAGGLVTAHEGRYVVSEKGLAMHRKFGRLRNLLGFDASGLYSSERGKDPSSSGESPCD